MGSIVPPIFAKVLQQWADHPVSPKKDSMTFGMGN